MATRWAICGAGKVAKDFCLVLNSMLPSEHKIVAVAAAKDAQKAEKFAKEHRIPLSFGSYEQMATLSDIGKNVLCEKPLAMSLDGCRQVLKAAREKNVFFLEGYWTRFFPLYKYLVEEIEKGTIGEVKHLDVSFGLSIYVPERLKRWQLGGGAIMDIGVYTILASSFFFKGRPSQVKAQITKDENGFDKAGTIFLQFGEEQTVNAFYSSVTAPGNSSLTVRGTKGNVVIPDKFWCPTTLYINGEKKVFPLPNIQGSENMVYPNSEGFYYEIKCARECLLKGLKECPHFTFEMSETQQWITQQVLDQAGIKFNWP